MLWNQKWDEGVHPLPPQKYPLFSIHHYGYIPQRRLIGGKQLSSSITIIYHHFAELESQLSGRECENTRAGEALEFAYEYS